MSRQLIIGAIQGYPLKAICPFFKSLKATGFAGDTVMFARNLPLESSRWLLNAGVQVVELAPAGLKRPFSNRRHTGQGRFGDVLGIVRRGISALPLPDSEKQRWINEFAERFFHIANSRFLLAGQFLAHHPARYSHVMITDVRDVVFQRDPFGFEGLNNLCTTYEHPSLSLATSLNYRDWIEAAFGDKEIKEFATARLSCCAITMGPEARMREYLDAMSLLIWQGRGRQPYLFGLDSAVHNHLIFHQCLKELRLSENFEGPVAHLGGIPEGEIPISSNGEVINRNGSPVNIVHQYDRHRAVLQAVLNRFE